MDDKFVSLDKEGDDICVDFISAKAAKKFLAEYDTKEYYQMEWYKALETTIKKLSE